MRFQLTESVYRSNEADENIPAVVSKNVRLANPVTFLLTPFNESEAIRTGQPLPANLPLDDNPLSPNRAKCKVLCIVCPPSPMFSYHIHSIIRHFFPSLAVNFNAKHKEHTKHSNRSS